MLPPLHDDNPLKNIRFPYVTVAFIAACVAVFVFQFPLGAREEQVFIYGFGAIPAVLFGKTALPVALTQAPAVLTLVTSMFLHGGIMHLLGNMLFLFIFGDNVEDEMGHLGFVVFYLVCGIAAGMAQYVTEPLSQIPTVGASGAIAGVMGAYLLLFPKAKVDILIIFVVFFKVFPIPAWIMLCVWFAMQLFGGVGAAAGEGGVAYWAHAGGFAIGALLALPLWLRLGGTRFWDRSEGHPPHPEAKYTLSRSRIPTVRRRR